MMLPNRLGALVAVLLLVSVSFQTVVVDAYKDGDGDGDGSRAAPMEEVPGPFRELDKLVAGLIAVTTDTTDTDRDDLHRDEPEGPRLRLRHRAGHGRDNEPHRPHERRQQP
jgi:hypothetical protein